MKERVRGKALLLGLSLIVSFGLGELCYRGYLWLRHKRHFERLVAGRATTRVHTIYLGDIVRLSTVRDVVYELKPNLRGSYRGHALKTNPHGMRGSALPTLGKPPNALRIVGIGDSFMFGQGVADEETYLAQLERRLAARAGAVEVLNFGTPGYNTTMEAALLEARAMAFAPDLVIVGVVGNDWDLPDLLRQGPRTRPLGSALLGAVAALFSRPALELTPYSASEPHRFGHEPSEAPAEYRHMVGYASFRNALRRIHAAAAAGKAKVALFSDCLPRERSTRSCDFSFAPGQREELWRAVKGWGFAVCRWTLARSMYLPDDGHPSARGHQELAAQLLACLDRWGWVPAARGKPSS